MRKTKIICTLGPSTDKDGVLRELVANGMNVARFNFSHGSYEEHKGRLDMLKAIRTELGKPVAALLDTKGPEIRLKEFKNGVEMLEAGQTFTLTTREVEGTKEICSITYKDLPQDVHEGGTIMLDDGLIKLAIKSVSDTDIVCEVLNSGKIKTKKGVNVPGVHLSMPYLSQRDRDDIIFGIQQGFDFIAASFVRTAQDVYDIRNLLNEYDSHIRIIAKIENREGVNNIDSILVRCRRRHGRPRRPGRRDRLHRAARHPEERHRPLLLLRQTHRHRHPDAGQHDGQPPPHPRRDLRRGQRHLRRHLCHHALRRDRCGRIPC